MLLSEMLTSNVIIPELKATDRWSCIGELVDCVVAAGHLSAGDRKTVYDLLVNREMLMTTGIGHGIAIPHASYDGTKTMVAAFGRSLSGISFEALDGKPVHYVTLLVVPKLQFQTHLRTLSVLAKFYNDPARRTQIDQAGSSEDIAKCFQVPID
ncbi:MAG: PTS sugar transporter subunit IIA [Verrucomicrobiota bacterium]|nr:PTS sugar transporter subunit IIA [Verrucomicrobiota bacterium]